MTRSERTRFADRKDAARSKELKYRDIGFKMDAVADDGSFEGYGSVFGVVDSYDEVVAPGAFAASLADLKASGRKLPALWNHSSNEPIGAYDSLVEDGKGLKVTGRLMIAEVAKAREIHALMKAKVISGLSIGYWVKDASYDQETGIVTLKELKLREISVVTFPANDESRIETVKAKLSVGGSPTLREFETFLRDAGWSRADATRIASKGYREHVRPGDPAGESDAIMKALRDVRATL